MADYTQDMTTGAFVGKAECRVLKASGWIPVEERLPEESGRYLVTTSYGTCTVASYDASMEKWGGYDNANFASPPIAWQPLPEPYKKPRRFVVGRHMYEPDGYLIRDTKVESVTVAKLIPTREAADKIADIYEEAYR